MTQKLGFWIREPDLFLAQTTFFGAEDLLSGILLYTYTHFICIYMHFSCYIVISLSYIFLPLSEVGHLKKKKVSVALSLNIPNNLNSKTNIFKKVIFN